MELKLLEGIQLYWHKDFGSPETLAKAQARLTLKQVADSLEMWFSTQWTHTDGDTYSRQAIQTLLKQLRKETQ